jgi:branched-chain amino acid transport system ATP-binding protein
LENSHILEVNNLNTTYGKVQALWDVSLHVNEAEIVALIGSNGAGKTTLFNTISGLLCPASGSITFMGNRIDRLPCNGIVEMGISYIPEGGRIFKEMTVRENLEMGAYSMHAWKVRNETFEQVYKVFPILKERAGQQATTLSGGEQQMLAMGRGLMSRPVLCMFDEPSYGLAPILVAEVFKVIQSLREQGITVLLNEQNVRHTLEIADRAYVLENGHITLEGTGNELLNSDYVRKAYLGR